MMSNVEQKLSALLDEYTADETCQATLDEIINDVNLQYRMHRYQMIGDIMRHELPPSIKPDFSHQIMTQIRGLDSTTERQPESIISNWKILPFLGWFRFKPLAGFAITLSVAMVSITLWQFSTQGDPTTELATINSGIGTRWTTAETSPALQQKLNTYLVNHTEYAIPMQSLIPQARVVGFDAQ